MNGRARLPLRSGMRQRYGLRCGFSMLLMLAAAWLPGAHLGSSAAMAATPLPAPAAEAAEELSEILVEAPEPRYVAPTRRDQIGRIWAPVYINGRGPFRLVLDTGATHSAVTAMVALALGISTDKTPPVLLHGVTGAAAVPTIHVDTLSVGDLAVDSPVLPIVPDAMGGAQGVLGSEGLTNKRIFIDFRHDEISIKYSHGELAERDFSNVPFHLLHGRLIAVDAVVGDVPTKAIIDTGGQATIANLALRDALARLNEGGRGKPDQIIGATLAVEDGMVIATPAIRLGAVKMVDAGIVFGDMYIFKQWHMTREPAILIGMDALGVLDALVIDYRRHELHMRAPKAI